MLPRRSAPSEEVLEEEVLPPAGSFRILRIRSWFLVWRVLGLKVHCSASLASTSCLTASARALAEALSDNLKGLGTVYGSEPLSTLLTLNALRALCSFSCSKARASCLFCRKLFNPLTRIGPSVRGTPGLMAGVKVQPSNSAYSCWRRRDLALRSAVCLASSICDTFISFVELDSLYLGGTRLRFASNGLESWGLKGCSLLNCSSTFRAAAILASSCPPDPSCSIGTLRCFLASTILRETSFKLGLKVRFP
mmetsp:Transcript_27704/g.54558  ORF Transcript_27704/g.54558 Transcript_27704/m.54558 type:complete len:251 (+) Transcript_27704:392-1144(+)